MVFARKPRRSPHSGGVASYNISSGCGSRIGTEHGTLVSGNMDQDSGGLILTRTQWAHLGEFSLVGANVMPNSWRCAELVPRISKEPPNNGLRLGNDSEFPKVGLDEKQNHVSSI